MAYEKQTWEDGVSPVNAERMNHMEEGIEQAGGGGPFVITLGGGNPDSGLPVDKPYAEIKAQIDAGNINNMYVVREVMDGCYIWYRPSMFYPHMGNAIIFSSIGLDAYSQIEINIAGIMPDPQIEGATVAMVMSHTIVSA